MPFAIALLQGAAMPEGCPLLSDAERKALEESITRSDWREDLIQSLRLKISTVDFSAITEDIGGICCDGNLIIECLGREFAISPDGEIETRGHITPWIKIILLHYITTHGKAELSGRWVSFSELKSGMVKASSFLREGEEPLKELFDCNLEQVSAVLEKLGARQSGDFRPPVPGTYFSCQRCRS